jgi:hypothetical protein
MLRSSCELLLTFGRADAALIHGTGRYDLLAFCRVRKDLVRSHPAETDPCCLQKFSSIQMLVFTVQSNIARWRQSGEGEP